MFASISDVLIPCYLSQFLISGCLNFFYYLISDLSNSCSLILISLISPCTDPLQIILYTHFLFQKNSIPAYFTDYCWRSFELTRTQVQSLNGFQICDGRINPFKSPIRIQSLDSDLPQYSNNILFYLKYK